MPPDLSEIRQQAGRRGPAAAQGTPPGATEGQTRAPSDAKQGQPSASSSIKPPAIALPKGGGALRGIGETFRTDPSRGTASLSVPIAISPGRGGAAPELALGYDSGSGAGVFGLGWSLSLPAISRRTDRGIPLYAPAGSPESDADVFVLSGAEDLVAVLDQRGPALLPRVEWRSWQGRRHRVDHYRPRIEGLFARIEHWSDPQSGESHWRTISRDNVTTFYGTSGSSRIADPDDPRRIFSWLISESRDPRGHLVLYEYKAEDSAGVRLDAHAEENRTVRMRTANRYPKRVRYGNRVSTLVDSQQARSDFMFELVFDYGEHDDDAPAPQETRPWRARQDPFSERRAGFEIRTYRLCRRLLMFHHFPEEPTVGRDCLVAATELAYGPAGGDLDKGLSCLRAVTHARFRRRTGGYLRKALPAVEFDYSPPVLSGEVREMPAESLENLPQGLAAIPGWIDLDGEGLAGLLVQQGTGWFYKRNLGEGRLGPLEILRESPSTARLGSANQQLLDLDGDGRLELVDLEGPAPGYYASDERLRWSRFSPFRSLPNLDWNDPNLRFLDLDGDGFADVLVTADDALVWHRSRRREGFAAAEHRAKPHDEEDGPRIVFSGAGQSIFLADMTGDGLTDLVRITHREVCYWPNLGHGRFGRRIVMDHAPHLASLEAFDPRRVRLADIDGSGPADLIYLGSDGVRLFPNRQGDTWGPEQRLPPLPQLDNLSEVAVVDLLGRGAACLVWSSRNPADAGRHVRYIDLMPAGKPHLLTAVRNNLGAETRVGYAPSTRFYLDDRAAGRPWTTRLPFPVQVVERVETFDHVSGSLFVSRYAYHHGYFDGREREFRGFAMVERWDTETYALLASPQRLAAEACNLDAASHRPPVLTRTWFHVGSLEQTAPGCLPLAVLPANLPLDERREACRALKGAVLREEVYALDGSAVEHRPYSVSDRNFTVRTVQRRGPNPHAVFLVHPRETLDSAGERRSDDPRLSHSVVLAVDDFGNPLSALTIAYGRRHEVEPLLANADRLRQRRSHVVHTISTYTAALDGPDDHLAPLPAGSDGFEIVAEIGAAPLTFEQAAALASKAATTTELAFGDEEEGEGAPLAGPHRRPVAASISLYRSDDLASVLPAGAAQSLALPYESYALALTDDLAQRTWGEKLGDALEEILSTEGGYVRLAGKAGWWAPSGRAFLSAAGEDAAAELEQARRGFFLARRFLDPFGAETVVTYDRYHLLTLETRDALGNRVTAGERTAEGEVSSRLDYRVLEPALVTDINRNRTAVAFDVLGMAAGVAVMGKLGESLGDTLDGFEADLDDDAVAVLLADPKAGAAAALAGATMRYVHDLSAFGRRRGVGRGEPAAILALAREIHASDLAPGATSPIRVSLSYFDGFSRQIQAKAEAEPGPIDPVDPDAPVVADRWATTGWTVFDNKGEPVRRYEPFFDDTHKFRFGRIAGASSILLRDPLGRVIGTLHPDHSFEKTRFDSWSQENWDANDTCLVEDPRDDEDVGGHFRRLGEEEFLPTWRAARMTGGLGPHERDSALKASVHAGTPDRVFVDALGRAICSISHNRVDRAPSPLEEFATVRTFYDALGSVRRTLDPMGRVFARHVVDLLGRRLVDYTLDRSWRRTLPDIEGSPLRAWDSRGHAFRNTYDALRRPTASWVTGAHGRSGEILFERTHYGDGPDGPDDAPPEARNLRGKAWRRRDTAGELTTAYDFKGNALSERRRLARDYRQAPDWSGEVALEDESHATVMAYDALNRMVQVVPGHRAGAPSSVLRLLYNEARLLEQVAVGLDLAELPAGLIDPAAATIRPVTRVEYDAHGRRIAIGYGNEVESRYVYDDRTFRLRRILTTRPASAEHPEALQDLAFTYDAVGNITHIADAAQPVVFFRNLRVTAEQDHLYDALYRLVRATGREHLGQMAPGPVTEPSIGLAGRGRAGLPSAGDEQAMGRYEEHYVYDLVGNILRLVHRTDAAVGGWTRHYHYDVEGGNRLVATAISDGPRTRYSYDTHGNTTAMPHLSHLGWDFEDRLASSARQVVEEGTPETTYYVYDSTGQRLRKVTERAARPGEAPRRVQERLYLGGMEILRRYEADGETLALERESLHVMDGEQRIALVETHTRGEVPAGAGSGRLVRYQLANQVGSATLELDETAAVISYEEFHPFGSTAYETARPGLESAKRYRFLGKERDEESGLSYHGARYYAPWLTRWLSVDPAVAEGPNTPYAYALNPIHLADTDGEAPENAVDKLLARARENVKDIEVRFKADVNDIAPYSAQGRSRWSSIWSSWKKGIRLTENEHIIAGGGLKRLDPRFIYRKAITLIVDREYAVGKTLGDRRLIGLLKRGAIDAGEFLNLSKANALRAYDNMVAQKGIFGAPMVSRENIAKVADLQIAETLKSIPATTRVSKFSATMAKVGDALGDVAKVGKPLLKIAKPLGKVVKPVAVGLAVFSIGIKAAHAAEAGPEPAADDKIDRWDKTAKKVEDGLDVGLAVVGLSGPAGLVVLGGEATVAIMPHIGADKRIVDAGKGTEDLARNLGSDNPEAWGAAAAGTTSVIEGATVFAQLSNPIGWASLGVQYYLHKK